jgi:rubrerythrin
MSHLNNTQNDLSKAEQSANGDEQHVNHAVRNLEEDRSLDNVAIEMAVWSAMREQPYRHVHIGQDPLQDMALTELCETVQLAMAKNDVPPRFAVAVLGAAIEDWVECFSARAGHVEPRHLVRSVNTTMVRLLFTVILVLSILCHPVLAQPPMPFDVNYESGHWNIFGVRPRLNTERASSLKSTTQRVTLTTQTEPPQTVPLSEQITSAQVGSLFTKSFPTATDKVRKQAAVRGISKRQMLGLETGLENGVPYLPEGFVYMLRAIKAEEKVIEEQLNATIGEVLRGAEYIVTTPFSQKLRDWIHFSLSSPWLGLLTAIVFAVCVATLIRVLWPLLTVLFRALSWIGRTFIGPAFWWLLSRTKCVSMRNRITDWYTKVKLNAHIGKQFSMDMPEELEVFVDEVSPVFYDEKGPYLKTGYKKLRTTGFTDFQKLTDAARQQGNSQALDTKESLVPNSRFYKAGSIPKFQGQFMVGEHVIGHFSRIKFRDEDCLITAFHVLEYNRNAAIRLVKNGKSIFLSAFPVEFVAMAPTSGLDFLIFKVPPRVFSELGLGVGQLETRISASQSVYIYQLHEGRPSFTMGQLTILTGEEHKKKPWCVAYGASTLVGSSGAPILTASGKIIGIHLEGGAGRNIGIIPPVFAVKTVKESIIVGKEPKQDRQRIVVPGVDTPGTSTEVLAKETRIVKSEEAKKSEEPTKSKTWRKYLISLLSEEEVSVLSTKESYCAEDVTKKQRRYLKEVNDYYEDDYDLVDDALEGNKSEMLAEQMYAEMKEQIPTRQRAYGFYMADKGSSFKSSVWAEQVEDFENYIASRARDEDYDTGNLETIRKESPWTCSVCCTTNLRRSFNCSICKHAMVPLTPKLISERAHAAKALLEESAKILPTEMVEKIGHEAGTIIFKDEIMLRITQLLKDQGDYMTKLVWDLDKRLSDMMAEKVEVVIERTLAERMKKIQGGLRTHVSIEDDNLVLNKLYANTIEDAIEAMLNNEPLQTKFQTRQIAKVKVVEKEKPKKVEPTEDVSGFEQPSAPPTPTFETLRNQLKESFIPEATQPSTSKDALSQIEVKKKYRRRKQKETSAVPLNSKPPASAGESTIGASPARSQNSPTQSEQATVGSSTQETKKRQSSGKSSNQ